MMSASIMDRMAGGTVLGAEGYVFALERRGYIKAGPFVPEVVLDFPDAEACRILAAEGAQIVGLHPLRDGFVRADGP